ncbi:MAG: family 10 glycosylhydrolase [Marinilabilia sp.]
MKRVLLLFLVIFSGNPFFAQETAPKREFRGAWITTVWGLDWPSSTIQETGNESEIEEQKQQFISLIESLKSANINAVFFQVRSECDAMYESSYEPWSTSLVAERGMEPGYDPLEFVIEECHKRGMEIHAWLNPYRFETVSEKYADMPGDYRQDHPEWVLEYPEKSDGSPGESILDPGNPEVRQRISDIVEEIITDYEVDGIVFDDYFYAYGGTPSDLDAYSQERYKPSGIGLDDWRRNNVNQMIGDVFEVIETHKPWVTFGVSPFGIWTTDEEVAREEGLELPSGITGMNAYKQIYCDPVSWLKNGDVDYLSPQLYWPTTSTGQDYEVLAPWWSDVCNLYGRHLYVSHSLSDLAESDYAPGYGEDPLKSVVADPQKMDLQGLSMLEYFSQPRESLLKGTLDASEFGKQVEVNRSSDKNGAPGSVFFRSSLLYTEGFINYLTDHEFSEQSLPPAINWKSEGLQSIPSNIRIDGDQLKWEVEADSVLFSIYAISEPDTDKGEAFLNPENLLGVSYDDYFDLSDHSELVSGHQFGVAVLDRYGNELPPALMDHTPSENEKAQLVWPEDEEKVSGDFVFLWDEVAPAFAYIVEISGDDSFEEILYRRVVEGDEFDASNVPLENGETYYWRLATRTIGAEDMISETRSFEYEEGTFIPEARTEPAELSCPSVLDQGQVGVEFYLPLSGQVRLSLLDIKGQQRKVLVNRHYSRGSHSVTMNTDEIGKGMYFLYLEWDGGNQSLKVVKL